MFATPVAKRKRHRAKTVRFDESRFYSALTALHKDPERTYNIDGSSYAKCSRSLGPDRDSLAVAHKLLASAIEVAPNGFPCGIGIRNCLAKLQI